MNASFKNIQQAPPLKSDVGVSRLVNWYYQTTPSLKMECNYYQGKIQKSYMHTNFLNMILAGNMEKVCSALLKMWWITLKILGKSQPQNDLCAK